MLVEQTIKCGELPISKLLFISGAEIIESNSEITDDLLYQQINSLYHTVKLLAEFRFIIQSTNLGIDEEPVSTTVTGIDADAASRNAETNLSLFVIPNVDLNQLLVQVKLQEKGNVEDFPDAEIYFKVNLKKFQEARRNQLVLSAMERKYKPILDPKLFEVILDLGFVKYPWEKESVPVSVNEVADIIRKALGDTPLNKYIDEHFEILGEFYTYSLINAKLLYYDYGF